MVSYNNSQTSDLNKSAYSTKFLDIRYNLHGSIYFHFLQFEQSVSQTVLLCLKHSSQIYELSITVQSSFVCVCEKGVGSIMGDGAAAAS